MPPILLAGTSKLANCFHGNKDENLPAQGLIYLKEVRKVVVWHVAVGVAQWLSNRPKE